MPIPQFISRILDRGGLVERWGRAWKVMLCISSWRAADCSLRRACSVESVGRWYVVFREGFGVDMVVA